MCEAINKLKLKINERHLYWSSLIRRTRQNNSLSCLALKVDAMQRQWFMKKVKKQLETNSRRHSLSVYISQQLRRGQNEGIIRSFVYCYRKLNAVKN